MRSAIRRPHGQQGFTLVEVLVATVLLALFLAALAPMLSAAALLRRQQELIAEATNLAQLEIEEIRRSWSALENRGLGSRQNVGGLVPTAMRDRLVPLPRPCVLSEVEYEGCKYPEPVPPGPLPLTASQNYPFDSDGYEVTSPDPSGEGADDLYLYDINREPPDSPRSAGFTMAGVRGPRTYRLQVFWGYAPGSATPAVALDDPQWYRQEVVRVVVRLYLAGKDGDLPVDGDGNPTRLTRAVQPLITARSEEVADTRSAANDPEAPPVFSPLAPLAVLSADIARSYQ
ncbi:MAG: prepilin-type N-terminal cleavage/methylation domain-containing protein [Aphanocapsa lilacina HA4352-LM1]|jgi:prepilin-type N-terminal cleavage/methylation domain-containing protein|nr:prepilin-type N-terminal cleavage/methylation domain-containing protein [Aphanocapsa lilacina HA4352-LM1]